MNMPAFTQRGTHKEKRVAAFLLQPVDMLAEWTGLEPATPGVTGRYSNQLNYHSMQRLLLRAKCCHLLPCNLRCLGDPTGIRTPVLTVKG